jgi:hypothetical protein
MAAPRVGEQLVVQDPLEGPEQDSGQVAVYDCCPLHSFLAEIIKASPAVCNKKTNNQTI